MRILHPNNKEKNMSVQDLVKKWENALSQALSSQQDSPELSDDDLETVEGNRLQIKSGLKAGGTYFYCD